MSQRSLIHFRSPASLMWPTSESFELIGKSFSTRAFPVNPNPSGERASVETNARWTVIVSNGDEMEVFPSLKPNRLDRRNKAQKHTRLQIGELGDFIRDLNLVIDAVSKLMDRMEPIFNAKSKALAVRIEQVKQQATDLPRTKKEFPQVAGG